MKKFLLSLYYFICLYRAGLWISNGNVGYRFMWGSKIHPQMGDHTITAKGEWVSLLDGKHVTLPAKPDQWLKFFQGLVDKYGHYTRTERYGSYVKKFWFVTQGEVNAQVYYLTLNIFWLQVTWDDVYLKWHLG